MRMTAPAGWQKGSFRGVAFVTREQEMTGGRRGVLHQFPQSNDPVWEDLGRGARRYHIDCHIIGADYPSKATALADALDVAGAGTLIHPWLGSMQVAVPEDGWSRRDSTSEGGYAEFSIDFVETGLPAVPQPTSDTASLAQAQASGSAAAAPRQFSLRYSLARATAFVESAAGAVVGAAALVTSIRGGLLGGAGPALRAFLGGIDLLQFPGSGLLRNALDLGLAITGMVQTLSVLGTGSQRVVAFHALMDFGSPQAASDIGDALVNPVVVDPVVGDTPARAQQRANQDAIIQLVNLAAAAELVRALSITSFASYQDAVAARDFAADKLEALALRQADAGDDAGAAEYDALRRVMVVDLTARGGSLARLQGYTPMITEPALVIASRLYGAEPALEDRAAGIVSRNGIAHPGFVPGGRSLQVLTPDGGSNG